MLKNYLWLLTLVYNWDISVDDLDRNKHDLGIDEHVLGKNSKLNKKIRRQLINLSSAG